MSINNIKLIDINKNLQKKVILNNINLEFNKGKNCRNNRSKWIRKEFFI